MPFPPGGMMPPTTTGTSPSPALAHPAQHLLDQGQGRAGEDREADDVDALLQGGVGDAGRGEADALVDHLDAGIAGGDGDLLGTVAVAVEAGLADQHLEAAAEAGVGSVLTRLNSYGSPETPAVIISRSLDEPDRTSSSLHPIFTLPHRHAIRDIGERSCAEEANALDITSYLYACLLQVL